MRTAPKLEAAAEEKSDGRDTADLVHRPAPRNTGCETPKNGFLVSPTALGFRGFETVGNQGSISAKTAPKQKRRDWTFQQINDVTVKITDGRRSLVPASHGQWPGYQTTLALGWLMGVGSGIWVVRIRRPEIASDEVATGENLRSRNAERATRRQARHRSHSGPQRLDRADNGLSRTDDVHRAIAVLLSIWPALHRILLRASSAWSARARAWSCINRGGARDRRPSPHHRARARARSLHP